MIPVGPPSGGPTPEHLLDDELRSVLERARALGFLGDQVLDRPIRHALGFAAILDDLGTSDDLPVVDLGSGGGLPGLVVAAALPRRRVVLIEAQQRRCEHLQSAVEALGWPDRVEVRCGRAEEIGRDPTLRASCQAVVSRSFGPPAVTAECAAPFLRAGGILVVSEPPDPGGSRGRWPEDGLAMLGLEYGSTVESPFRYAVINAVQPCPERFPRRVGVPAKRPLW